MSKILSEKCSRSQFRFKIFLYFLTVYTVYAVCMYICATWPGFEGLKCQEYNFHGQEGGALLENS